MADIIEPSIINNKKNKNTTNTSNIASKTKSMAQNISNQLLILCVIIISGTSILWSARVHQSSILNATSCSLDKLTNDNTSINPINIDIINIANEQNENQLYSTKINFNNDGNKKLINNGFVNKIICNLIYGKKSSNLTLYLGTILQNMSSQYHAMVEWLYSILNIQNESIIIFIFSLLLLFPAPIPLLCIILTIFGFINFMYGLFLWISNFSLFFSTKIDDPSKVNGTSWVNHDWSSDWVMSIIYIFIEIILIGFGGFICFCFLILNSFNTLFMPFFIKADVININKDDKSSNYSFLTLLKNILINKRLIITIIIIFLITVDISSAFGVSGILIPFFGCLIIHGFFPIAFERFKPSNEQMKLFTKDLATFDKYNINSIDLFDFKTTPSTTPSFITKVMDKLSNAVPDKSSNDDSNNDSNSQSSIPTVNQDVTTPSFDNSASPAAETVAPTTAETAAAAAKV